MCPHCAFKGCVSTEIATSYQKPLEGSLESTSHVPRTPPLCSCANEISSLASTLLPFLTQLRLCGETVETGKLVSAAELVR